MNVSSAIENILSRLAAVPALITSALEGWSDEELRIAPAPDAWSAIEIFAHVRASNDLLTQRAYAIIVRQNAPLAAFDERRWAEVAGYVQEDIHTSLTVFTLRRAELVCMLQRIAPADWRRVGVHEVYGPQKLFDMVKGFVEHEEEHCTQLAVTCHR